MTSPSNVGKKRTAVKEDNNCIPNTEVLVSCIIYMDFEVVLDK
jgi:hypothetical protein